MKTRILCLCWTLGLLLGAGAWAQPDLQVSSLVVDSPSTLICGIQIVTVTLDETNAGAGESGAYHLDLLWSTGSGFQSICRLARPNIRPSRTRTIQMTCTYWNGPCTCEPYDYLTTFQAQIDSLNEVAESAETNNLSNQTAVFSTCP